MRIKASLIIKVEFNDEIDEDLMTKSESNLIEDFREFIINNKNDDEIHIKKYLNASTVEFKDLNVSIENEISK